MYSLIWNDEVDIADYDVKADDGKTVKNKMMKLKRGNKLNNWFKFFFFKDNSKKKKRIVTRIGWHYVSFKPWFDQKAILSTH